MNNNSPVTILAACMYRGSIKKCSVTCEVSAGIGYHLVGIPDEAVKETLLRTITALQSLGYHLPGKKVVIRYASLEGKFIPRLGNKNVCPSLDLATAMVILLACGQISPLPKKELLFIGEIGLDGSIRFPETGMSNPRDAAAVIDWQLQQSFDAVIGWNTSYPLNDAGVWQGFNNLSEVIDYLNTENL